MKRTRVLFLTVSLVVVFVSSSLLVVGLTMGDDDLFKALGNLAEVVHLVETEYVDELNDEALVMSLDAGIVESVDPWGAVLPHDQVDRFTDLVARRPAFGLALGSRFGSAAVRQVFEDSPAATAGVEAWEVIELVDGISTRGRPLWLTMFDLAEAEEKGETVTLTMFDSAVDERREVVLTPAPWTVTTFDREDLDGAQRLTVRSLPEGAAAKVEAAIDPELPLILDLRELTWGLESECLQLADVLVDTGRLASWTGKKAGNGEFAATAGAVTEQDIVVLVGANTEGVGEILAAALKTSGAKLVGAKTIGHAPHMQMVSAGDVSLWIPVGLWMLDEETAISESGIEPDEVVEAVDAATETADDDAEELPEASEEAPDPVVERALELLQPALERAA